MLFFVFALILPVQNLTAFSLGVMLDTKLSRLTCSGIYVSETFLLKK